MWKNTSVFIGGSAAPAPLGLSSLKESRPLGRPASEDWVAATFFLGRVGCYGIKILLELSELKTLFRFRRAPKTFLIIESASEAPFDGRNERNDKSESRAKSRDELTI